jgi:hypothetical protein
MYIAARERKKWEPVEHRMASEYISKYFPGEKYAFRVRVGRLPEQIVAKWGPEAERWLKIMKHWVDAIVFRPGSTLIFEFKVYAKAANVYQLLDYVDLFKDTPEFEDRRNLPIQPYLVAAISRPDVPEICSRRLIAFRIYRPKWILPILWDRYKVEVTETLEQAP